MFKRNLSWTLLLAAIAGGPLLAQPQISGTGSCSSSTLNTTYAVSIASRQVTNGTFSTVEHQLGTVVFDGNGNATFNTTVNSNSKSGQTNTSTATYSLNANCTGTLTNGSVTFSLVVYALGSSFNSFTLTGNNGGLVVTGNGTPITTSCMDGGAASFVINANGFALNGTTVTGAAELTGLFQVDGMGNLTATWSVANGTTTTTVNAKGQYSIGTNCQGGITLVDNASMTTYVFSFAVVGNGNNFNFIGSSPSLIFAGAGHDIS